ncbi:autoinducer binding domain-containing protein [Pseudorhodobacter sp. W20_MBD10_FR17]
MRIENFRSQFALLAPAGCYIALRVGFFAPEDEMNIFPTKWIDHYTLSGMALVDPLLRWCQKNEGCARWRDIEEAQPLNEYRSFGMHFGSVVSIFGTIAKPKRSLGIFARNDRDLDEAEMAELGRLLRGLHAHETRKPTKSQLEALRLFAQGLPQKQIAHELGISIGAVKGRLRGGAERLEVRTPVEAAFLADRRGLL